MQLTAVGGTRPMIAFIAASRGALEPGGIAHAQVLSPSAHTPGKMVLAVALDSRSEIQALNSYAAPGSEKPSAAQDVPIARVFEGNRPDEHIGDAGVDAPASPNGQRFLAHAQSVAPVRSVWRHGTAARRPSIEAIAHKSNLVRGERRARVVVARNG